MSRNIRVCSIASGSSGNCTFIESGEKRILIDAGISRKRIVEGLSELGVSADSLDAIFVTHEHTDHIKGIPMMAKMFEIPIYATKPTLDEIIYKDKKGEIDRRLVHSVTPDESYIFGDMDIVPYHISHDAACPVGYTVRMGEHKVSLATDLGVYDDYIVENLKGSDVLFLESNHDITMVETGPYPYQLKLRILGHKGHLSNEASGSLLSEIMRGGTALKKVFLSHLSKENNYPRLAYEAVKCQIWEELGTHDYGFDMYVSNRDMLSEAVVL